MKKKVVETDLADPIRSWFTEQGYEVYQEVCLSGGSCDIVATTSKLTVAVEMKTSLNFDVFAQALRWVGRAHFVYVAVPKAKGRELAKLFAENLGVGILEVYKQEVKEVVAPRLRRRISDMRRRLKPEQKYVCKAGSVSGRYTPFKATCFALCNLVLINPGITLKAALARIKTHYRSPKTAMVVLPKMVFKGVIPGLRIEKEGKELRLFLDEIPFRNAYSTWTPGLDLL